MVRCFGRHGGFPKIGGPCLTGKSYLLDVCKGTAFAGHTIPKMDGKDHSQSAAVHALVGF